MHAEQQSAAARQEYADTTNLEEYIPIDYKDYQYAEEVSGMWLYPR
ncbi:MAG: hypothetical protein U5J63_08585 [Fodinibius sp.]|nr:hypothetical protein [Fodinibius sp.]